MTYKTVNYRVDDHVAIIELNRPEALNSFDTQLRVDLLAAVNLANADEAIRVVIVTGAGRGFSAGADLTDIPTRYPCIGDEIVEEYKPIFMEIYNAEKLYISAVNGPCAGIGTALAMSCDFAVMAEDSYLYMAFATIGLVPDGGISWQLQNAIGAKRALQLIVESGRLSAADCLAYGLANKVVPADELLSRTQAWATQLALGSPISQKLSKRILHTAIESNLSSTIDIEAQCQNITEKTQDVVNAIQAFMNKEKPVFEGK